MQVTAAGIRTSATTDWLPNPGTAPSSDRTAPGRTSRFSAADRNPAGNAWCPGSSRESLARPVPPSQAFVSEFSRASKLFVHPFDPLSARCGSHEWIRKVLCLPRHLVAPELHDAHGVRRFAVICQDEFGDPKITAANDSSDNKPLLVRLASALVPYVVSTARPLN